MTHHDTRHTNAERQRRLRQRRKEAGLVDYRRAVTPEQAKALDDLLARLNHSSSAATLHIPTTGAAQ